VFRRSVMDALFVLVLLLFFGLTALALEVLERL